MPLSAFVHPAYMEHEKQLASIHLELAASAADDGWIMLFPYTGGKPQFGNDGRGPYLLDDMDAVIQASLRERVELAIDYDHATDLLPPGAKRIAAGWMKELQRREDGIYARVEWTPAAKQHLADQEYRYLSPTFYRHPKTNRVMRISRAALTNDPNLEVKALAATEGDTSTPKETTQMDNETLKAIAEHLGLGADASEASVLEAVQKLKGDIDVVIEEVAAPADATGEQIVELIEEKIETETAAAKKALASTNPDPAKFVPIEGYVALQQQLASSQAGNNTAKIEAMITAASEAGTLPPAMHGWARELAASDFNAFEKYVGAAPKVVAAGAAVKTTAAKQAGSLDDDQKTLCASLGVSEADFAKAR